MNSFYILKVFKLLFLSWFKVYIHTHAFVHNYHDLWYNAFVQVAGKPQIMEDGSAIRCTYTNLEGKELKTFRTTSVPKIKPLSHAISHFR